MVTKRKKEQSMTARLAMTLLGALLFSSVGLMEAQEIHSRAPQYDLLVNIHSESHHLAASGALRLASADTIRDRVQLRLSDTMSEFSIEIVEPAESQGKAKMERTGRPGAAGGGGAHTWAVIPSSPFPAGKAILLRMSWSGGASEPSNGFYLGPEVSFASGISTMWYPQQQDPSGGTLAGVGRLTFRAPKDTTVVADGIREGGSQDSGEFRFLANAPTYFSFASGNYAISRKDGPAGLAAFVLRPRENVQTYLDGCARVIDRLVQEYGPNPYGGGFSIIEVPIDKFAGSSGAGFPNFIFINSASLDAPFNPVLFGHEIGHIWWGNLVKQKGNAGRYMLDEGMAQYSALVALEELEGPRASERVRRHGDPASPVESSASTYFALAAAGLDHPLSQLPNEWNSRNLVNSKGPLVVDLLARTIGRGRFREILRSFLKEHAFSKVTWEQFTEAFSFGTQGSSRPFFARWFDTTGAPDWRLTWAQEGNRISGMVSQELESFNAAVDIEITFTDGRRMIKQLEIRPQPRTEFAWQVDGKVRDLILDPDYQVLHWTPEYRREAPLLAAYWKAFVKDDTQHEAALADLQNAINQIPADDTAGVRFMLEELTARLLADDARRLGEAKAHLERGLMSASRRIERLGWAYWLLGYIASKEGDRAALDAAIQGAVASDAVVGGWSGWGPATRALRPMKPASTGKK
jgi:hypothetical protein